MSAAPRPWQVCAEEDNALMQEFGIEPSDWAGIRGADGRYVGSAYCKTESENLANANLIVHAVNCHDELVAALEALVAASDSSVIEIRAMGLTPDGRVLTLVERARAALARARGDQP